MNKVISMSIKELDRLKILDQLEKKLIKQGQAADFLGVSTRQIRTLIKAYKTHGAMGIISKKRGKPGNRQLPKSIKDLALDLIEANYAGFGSTLAQEKLSKLHNLRISVSLVRGLMISKGFWKERKKKKENIHQLRERRDKEGELVHIDASPHAWFEDRSPKCALLLAVDDATSKIMSVHFASSEALWPYFELIHSYISKYGRMSAIYCDKHSVFRINRKGALAEEGIIQFGRGMKELDVKMIFANSPQAKGRIPRPTSKRAKTSRYFDHRRSQCLST